MAFQNYGGYIWSDNPAYEENGWLRQGVGLGVAAGLGIGGAKYLTTVNPETHTRPIDALATLARTAGNATPWQIGNTFRIPEFLSPYTSPIHQGMTPAPGTDMYKMSWEQDGLQGRSTYEYIKKLSGLDTNALRARGITTNSFDADLVYKRSAHSSLGTLYSSLNGKEAELAKDVSLFKFSGEGHDVINLGKPAPINKAAESVIDAMGRGSISSTSLFFNPNAAENLQRPGYFPVPGVSKPDVSTGVHGAARSFDRSSTLLRAFPAFSMGRLNRLVEGTATTVAGETGRSFVKSVFGTGVGVAGGPGSAMFMRFGKGAGMLGLGALAVGQTDWLRREFESPGEVVASSVVGAGVSFGIFKAGFSGKTAAMAGVASFFGQMLLPGFGEGVVPGIATTYANATVARATAFNPINYYRRTLEGFAPGSTDWKTGALLGTGVALAAFGSTPYGKTGAQHLLDRFGHKAFGLKSADNTRLKHTKSIRHTYWDEMLKTGTGGNLQFGFGGFKDKDKVSLMQAYKDNGENVTWGMRAKIIKAYDDAGLEGVELAEHANKIWSYAEEVRKKAADTNPLNESLRLSLLDVDAKYGDNSFMRQLAGFAQQYKHSFFGAEIHNPVMTEVFRKNKFKAPLGRLGVLFGGTMLAHQVITGGLLGSLETSEDLRDIYSGEQLVSIGKSRWWECLSPETVILTEYGSKQIQDIKAGDHVLTKTGKYHSVLKVHKYVPSNRMLEIRTWGNGLRLQTTENHSVFVRRNNKVIETFASAIQDNDELVVPKPLRTLKNYGSLDLENYLGNSLHTACSMFLHPKQRNRSGGIQKARGLVLPRHITIDHDLGYLLGFYLGDGNLMRRKGGIEFAFGMKEQDYANDISRIIQSKFGIECTQRIKQWQGKDSAIIVRACSSVLGVIFDNLFGIEKAIPSWMYNIDNINFVNGVLIGFIHSDGNKHKKQYCITAKKIEHLFYLREQILYWFDCWSSVSWTGTAYRLSFRDDFKCSYGVTNDNQHVFLKVRSVKEVESPDSVYDLTVCCEHNYTTANGLVHNSGGTPFEGSRIEMFRPHSYALMKNRVRQKGIWGPNEDEISPVGKFLRKNLTYELERQQYYDRPYPISSGFMSDMPIVGGILSGTIGRWIKPPKLMHTSEWMRPTEHGIEHASVFQGARREPAYALGAPGPGVPVSPFAASKQLAFMNYQFREMEGLTGFMKNQFSKIVLGTDRYQTQPELADAGQMTSFRRQFWEMSMGGGFFCFVPGTLIETFDATKPIEQIVPGDKVFNQEGYCIVKGLLKKPSPEEIVAIKSIGGGIDIKCTRNHHIPVLRRRRYSNGHVVNWDSKNACQILELEAQDIKVGDCLLVPKLQYESNYTIDLAGTGSAFTDSWIYKNGNQTYVEILEAVETGRLNTRKEIREAGYSDLQGKEALRAFRYNDLSRNRIPRFIPITQEVAFALGFYVAEGNSDSCVHYTMHASEEKEAQRILQTWESFGFNGRYAIEQNTLKIWIYSTQLARWLRVFGHHARNKHIPTFIKHLPAAELTSFVDGLVQGDGWHGGFTSVSRQLCKDLSMCLYKLGRPNSLYLDYLEKGRGSYPQGTPKKDTLRHYVRFHNGKTDGPLENYTLRTVNFVEIVKADCNWVYDISVQDEHYYTADGALVHNTNEAVRRFFPSYDRDIERRNPIMNSMPGWMPDRFRHGDPYRAVPWGEGRLPGTGYAALHPELKGLDPEDYPLVHRYGILANVAPFSKELIATRQSVYNLRQQGGTSERQNEFIDRVDDMVRKTYNVYDFDRRHERAIELPGSRLTQAALSTAQDLFRETVAPAEYMIPFGFRPVQKLMGDRQPIERYEYERMYGTQLAFWDKPWRDWFRPAAYSAAHMLGYEAKPQWRKDADDNAAYFDKIEFVKWMRLADQASAAGDGQAASQYEYKASQTRFGVNPQGNPLGMYWSLPSEERAFFNAFAHAKGSKRERIMQMVPEDQVHLYQAVWSRMDRDDPMMWAGAPIQPDKEYLQQQYRNAMGGNDPLPPEDWIGHHEDVDISDIRVRYVNEMGKDLHDYGLWENQLKKSMSQPFLEGSTDYLHQSDSVQFRQSVRKHFDRPGSPSSLQIVDSPFSRSGVQVEYNDDREHDIIYQLERYIDDY